MLSFYYFLIENDIELHWMVSGLGCSVSISFGLRIIINCIGWDLSWWCSVSIYFLFIFQLKMILNCIGWCLGWGCSVSIYFLIENDTKLHWLVFGLGGSVSIYFLIENDTKLH